MGFGEDVVVRLEGLWADLTTSADKVCLPYSFFALSNLTLSHNIGQ